MIEIQTLIPKNIFDYWLPKLKPSACIVLFCLFNMRNDKNIIATTNDELKDIMAVAKSTIARSLLDLQRFGLITKTVTLYGHLHSPYEISLCMDVINQQQKGENL